MNDTLIIIMTPVIIILVTLLCDSLSKGISLRSKILLLRIGLIAGGIFGISEGGFFLIVGVIAILVAIGFIKP